VIGFSWGVFDAINGVTMTIILVCYVVVVTVVIIALVALVVNLVRSFFE
jgi:hypothetical protein